MQGHLGRWSSGVSIVEQKNSLAKWGCSPFLAQRSNPPLPILSDVEHPPVGFCHWRVMHSLLFQRPPWGRHPPSPVTSLPNGTNDYHSQLPTHCQGTEAASTPSHAGFPRGSPSIHLPKPTASSLLLDPSSSGSFSPSMPPPSFLRFALSPALPNVLLFPASSVFNCSLLVLSSPAAATTSHSVLSSVHPYLCLQSLCASAFSPAFFPSLLSPFLALTFSLIPHQLPKCHLFQQMLLILLPWYVVVTLVLHGSDYRCPSSRAFPVLGECCRAVDCHNCLLQRWKRCHWRFQNTIYSVRPISKNLQILKRYYLKWSHPKH